MTVDVIKGMGGGYLPPLTISTPLPTHTPAMEKRTEVYKCLSLFDREHYECSQSSLIKGIKKMTN